MRAAALLFASLSGAALVVALLDLAPEASQDPTAPAPAATVDVVALDREGRFVDGLGASDFAATVDGVRRPVLWVRRVSRGPGAMADAATRQARGDESVQFAAEAVRTVLVAVDQASIHRGDEREVVQAAGLFLDRLGLNDRVAVVGIPLPPGERLVLTTDRAEARSVLAHAAGRLALPAAPAAIPPPLSGVPAEQARMTGLEPDRSISVDPASPAAPPDTLNALREIFETLARLPGRKVVAVFSAGLPASANALVDDTARAAAAARAVVYGFGARASRGADAGSRLTLVPLERLATATGGAFSPPGQDTGRDVARTADGLGACYVLGLEAGPQHGGGRALRVETTRTGVTLRTGGWIASAADAGDEVLVRARPAVPEPAAEAARHEAPRPGRVARDDAELQVALARLFDYADGYERQYSMLVAEEDYKQSARGSGVRLRSDLLLVRLAESGEWVSFRDVFEVDGRPVRDREERLRRLFLEATPDAVSRLRAISEESARYNVGWVERTANVPLLPLSFLRPDNRGRFQYELAGRSQAGGIAAWRIGYTELARPTLIGDPQGDLPVSGWFLVDSLTGAIVETRMAARRGDATAEIIVRYRSDAALGLWVPAEMRESYGRPEPDGLYGRARRGVLEGRATYSSFRRYQVTTEEKVAPPR